MIVADDAYLLAGEIARVLAAPHLELRIQESDHWDFTLFRGEHVLADFSTRVSYFESDPAVPRPWKKGNAKQFATIWGIPLERVSPYLVDWESPRTPRFAVEDDCYPVGDWRQIFDFMQAIGVENPVDHPNHFEFCVPAWEGTYVTQPWWRRVIRALSVKIKGTYPDVPRLTPQERNLWEQRRASVRLVTIDLDKRLSEDLSDSSDPHA